ncbi:hypothetical protein ACFV4N_12825 [Actinosynnema sp. NPDC059797]
MPDAFTPDTTNTAAATPTCCCCCCCAVSSVGAAVSLPTGLAGDLEAAGHPAGKAVWAKALWVLPAALYLPGLLLLPFVEEVGFALWYGVGGGAVALLWTFLAARFTGARAPWRGPVRLVFWCAAFVGELFLSLPLLGVLVPLGPVFGTTVYSLLAVGVGVLTYRVHRLPEP